MKAIGIDVGGTFIDYIYFDDEAERIEVLKLSSGGDAAVTVADGMRALCESAGASPAEIDLVMHGTTVATNALLEHRGAKTGMVTTQGFRDVIHIGRHQRPQNYSLQQDIPWQARPLALREYRRPVRGRLVPPDGDELEPLDLDAVRGAAELLAAEGIESVAICFLFSYLNPSHEDAAAEVVREVMPGAYVCTSSDVVSQFREFERFTTTAINAFVGPAMKSYIERLEERISASGFNAALHIMQSNGGTATPEVASRYPVRAILSGPAGGVMGGVWASARRREEGRRHLATLDVGGTSADIGIVTEAGLVEAKARDTWIAGYPVMVPIIDIETIGAGGGSIAHLDKAGALHVGPRSAGAEPGPAAYGHGGTEATLTDANVVLGRLPHTLAGGLELELDAARDAIARIGEEMGLSTIAAAAAIVRIVNENMAAAVRTTTVERGLDPREFLLCAFGGGGPAQAAELARILEIPEVLIPPHPGVTSAAGLLTSDLRYDVGLSYLRDLADVEPGDVEEILAAREAELRAQLHADGRSDAEIRIQRSAELRYKGQSWELPVAIGEGEVAGETLERLREGFHAAHEEEFGHRLPEQGIELVTLKVTATGALPHITQPAARGEAVEAATKRTAEVQFEVDGKVEALPTRIIDRERMPVGEPVDGPAIIVQLDSTTVVPPGAVVQRDGGGNLLLDVGDGRS